jgi:hypothetical protein
VPEDEPGEEERGRHLHELRPEQDAAPVEAVREDSAEEREEEERRVAEERVEPEEERGAAQRQDEPVLRDLLQFCATSCIQVPTAEVNAPPQRSR